MILYTSQPKILIDFTEMSNRKFFCWIIISTIILNLIIILQFHFSVLPQIEELEKKIQHEGVLL